jgi:HEAT repeat protein
MLNLIIIRLLLLCAASFAFSQNPQKSTAAYEAFNENTLTVSQVAGREVSERMMGKMREMEKAAVGIKGQDDTALEKIGEKIDKTIVLMPLNRDLISAVKDKRFDWRIRYLLMLYKSYTAGDSKITEYSEDFIDIMRDKTEHTRVRGMAALMLVDISAKNAKVNEALKETAKAQDTPGDVLKAVMTAVGYAGIDDADVLMKLTEREPADFNEVGINLNAVRALGKSKDPRAIGYLIKIFDESGPDSFYQVTAIQQFSSLIKDPETRARVKPLIVQRFLKLLDDRSYLGVSRNEASDILAKMDIKEAVEPILKWFLPANETHAKVGGGGNRMDIMCGIRALVKLGDKKAIPILEQTIANFANDSRWSWSRKEIERNGRKFPEEHPDYKSLKKCLRKLKNQK